MKISRRNFIGALSASLATGLPAAAAASKSIVMSALGARTAAVSKDALARLGWNSFQSNLFTDFEFSSPTRGRRVTTVTRMNLLSVSSDLPVKAKGAEPECFALTFKSRVDADGPRLSQNTYTVDHFALGQFDLFISEANRVDDSYVYTAVINRMTE